MGDEAESSDEVISLRNEHIQEQVRLRAERGGFLAKEQDVPGPIPVVDDPNGNQLLRELREARRRRAEILDLERDSHQATEPEPPETQEVLGHRLIRDRPHSTNSDVPANTDTSRPPPSRRRPDHAPSPEHRETDSPLSDWDEDQGYTPPRTVGPSQGRSGHTASPPGCTSNSPNR